MLQATIDPEDCACLGQHIMTPSSDRWMAWLPDVLAEVTWQRFIAKPLMAAQLVATGESMINDTSPWTADNLGHRDRGGSEYADRQFGARACCCGAKSGRGSGVPV